MRNLFVVAALFTLVLVPVGSCGKAGGGEPAAPAAAPAAAAAVANEGEVLAKEVIAAFDEIVAEVAAALDGKPDQDTAVPKLQGIYDAWKPKMEAFAARRKAFEDPAVRGAFNGYMGQQRGPAMFRKDQALGAVVGHYRNMSPGPEVVAFVETKLVELMEIAHNR